MAGLLDIDAHGRVVPQSDETRRALADRAGRFALLPAAADLLVALRTPAAGGAAPRPRLVLAGDLSAVPIGDFVAFVHQSKLSGTMTVSAAGVERTLSFREGEVRSALSTAPGERLGDVAVRLGFATPAQVERAVAAGGQVGRALVDQGAISAKDLWRCFHEQVAAVFHAILLLHAGVFVVLDEDPAEHAGTPLSVSTQSLLMDGIRRIDELSLFRGRIPDAAAVLRRRDPIRAVTLKGPEQALLALVDGRRTVAEIAAAAHLSEFDATKVLYHLAEAGYVDAAAAARAPDPAARLDRVARALCDLLRLVTAAVPAEARASFLSEVRGALSDPATPFAPLWARVVPGEDGGVEPAAVLSNLAALRGPALEKLGRGTDRVRVLREALTDLLFFYLFAAGSRVAREADDALAAEVKRRLAPIEAA
jgi:hypothetical protein